MYHLSIYLFLISLLLNPIYLANLYLFSVRFFSNQFIQFSHKLSSHHNYILDKNFFNFSTISIFTFLFSSFSLSHFHTVVGNQFETRYLLISSGNLNKGTAASCASNLILHLGCLTTVLVQFHTISPLS